MMIHNNKISDNLISFTSKKISGKIYPPADKSISHRSLIISSLAVGKSRIENLLESEDVMHMVQALKLLGVKIDKNKKGIWEVFGVGLDGFTEPEYLINCGNSGTLARTLIGAVTGNSIVVTFTGDKSLNERPMERVIIPLEKMGAQIVSTANNRLPLTVKGTTNLLPIKYENPISSAQVKTSVLLAALNVRGVTEFVEPYTSRDHTEIMLKKFGAKIRFKSSKNKKNVVFIEGGVNLKGNDIYVPSDLSSASFAIIAASIVPGSYLKLNNVCINYFRTGILDALKKMGADISITNRNKCTSEEPIADIEVKYSKLKGLDLKSYCSSRMIDEYPILSIAASVASGKTILRGLRELKVKESNRFDAIINGLRSCGVKVNYKGEDIIINGASGKIKGGTTIDSNFDHRIAMSFLVLGGVSKNPISVKGCKSILTSYPNFLCQMNSIGMDIRSND